MMARTSIPVLGRIAALLALISGVGFGVFCPPLILSLLRGHGILYVMNLPTYGNGPFEQIGVPTTVPLVAAFLLVCILECIAGWLLWSGYKSGAILALVLFPIGALFWWGFRLPFGPMLAFVRTILIVMSWQTLR
jgi:hypothetical protein